MALVSPFWFDMADMWVGTFFYGIYLVLFCICMYILLHRPHDRANNILISTAVALFVLCTVQEVFNILLGTAEILYFDDSVFPYDAVYGADNFLYDVNNIIADSLVIYRCYVIWNRSFLIIIPGIAGLIITMALALLAFIDENVSLTPYFVMSLATNLTLSFLTAARIWWVCHQSRLLQQKTETQRQYVTTMAIIIESGIIYSLFVLAWLIVRAFPNTESSADTVFEMLRQMVGIVPTLIIVRVGLGVSVDNQASVSTSANLSSVNFASRSALNSENSFAARSLNSSRGRPFEPIRVIVNQDSDAEKGFDVVTGSIAGTGGVAGW